MTDQQSKPPRVLWLRRGLRLGDNPTFAPVVADARRTISPFIDDDGIDAARRAVQANCGAADR